LSSTVVEWDKLLPPVVALPAYDGLVVVAGRD
jgi:hypothetical protein